MNKKHWIAEVVLIVGYSLVCIPLLFLLGVLMVGRLPFLPLEWLWKWAQRQVGGGRRGSYEL